MKSIQQPRSLVAIIALLTVVVACGTSLSLRKKLECHRGCYCSLFKRERVVMRCSLFNLTGKPLPTPPKQSKNLNTSIYLENGTIPALLHNTLSEYSHYRIVILSLKNNTIRNIYKHAFSRMRYLQTLDLSENFIAEDILKESFYGIAMTPIKELNISSMNLTNVSDDFFEHLENITNVRLTFRNNTSEFPRDALQGLRHLTDLDFGGNRLKAINLGNASFPSLQTLSFDNNHFYEFPNLCSSSIFPNLKHLSIQWNGMRYLDRNYYSCLKNLTNFYLNGNLFPELKSNQFSMLPYIYKITLSYVGCAMHTIERAVFNNSALKQIFFRKNRIWFREAEIDMRVFEGCPSLELLNLNDNVFQVTTEIEFNTLFGDLTNLKTLVMGGNGLQSIPQVITRKLTSIKSLALYRNSISDLKPNTFENMTKLKKLFLANNEISTIDKQSLPKDLKQFEMFGNPLSCTCDMMWFVDWMRKDPETFGFHKTPQNKVLYNCSSPVIVKGVQLLDLKMSEISCLMDQDVKIITLTFSTLLTVFLVTGAVMYRYRWHIRYLIYMVRYSQRQEVDTADYEYDAFVAYSAPDRHWVIRNMLPVLEGKENFKLCVHDRDFEVGKLIVDNIVDAIEASRKIIIVLSNSFAQSDWCRFELNLIQRHVLENGQRLLVVVMLEEIDTRHMTKAMRAMLQTTTYLMWGEEEYARKAFFNRLRMLLRSPTRNAGKRRLSV
ncbi:toll-like receptor 13 [Haliotis cracherodii]|uniref:toll-like receptor 13 n=1 Tax=Haliotis cracherodii TaxID=6455 RepID=UPI0039E9CB3E